MHFCYRPIMLVELFFAEDRVKGQLVVRRIETTDARQPKDVS